jgi:hypothetical protein
VGVVNVVSAGSVPVVEMVSPGRLESVSVVGVVVVGTVMMLGTLGRLTISVPGVPSSCDAT